MAVGLALLLSAAAVDAQGTFQNMGFESAQLSPIPAGQYGGEVPVTNALPYWTAYLGANQVTQVLQNNGTLGLASIDIFGPNLSFGGIIEGQYTVVLQPGLDPYGSGPVAASISQTALVPATAQSLQFKAQVGLGYAFSVSLGGQNLSIVSLGTGADYTLYGANIPLADAGQDEALTVTASAAQITTTELFDSFVFSSAPVPEPSAFALTAAGALLLGWYAWRRRLCLNYPAANVR